MFDLSLPHFETRAFLEQHDELGDCVVTHRDRQRQVIVLRRVDDVANVSDVDPTFESELVRAPRHVISNFPQAFPFVVCDTENRFVEELSEER